MDISNYEVTLTDVAKEEIENIEPIRKFTWKNRLFKIIRELIYSKMLMKEE